MLRKGPPTAQGFPRLAPESRGVGWPERGLEERWAGISHETHNHALTCLNTERSTPCHGGVAHICAHNLTHKHRDSRLQSV